MSIYLVKNLCTPPMCCYRWRTKHDVMVQIHDHYVNSYTTYGQPKKNRSRRRRHSAQHHKNQLLNDEEEETVKDKSPILKSTSSTKQVYKEKGSSSSLPSQEVQPGLPFQPSDAPNSCREVNLVVIHIFLFSIT
jgi:hypothetical protein